jgi:hypothetical protein
VVRAKDSYWIAGSAARGCTGLIQDRTPLLAKIFDVIGVQSDANPVSLRMELLLNRGNFKQCGKSSERQARDTTGLGVYSCRPDLPFVDSILGGGLLLDCSILNNIEKLVKPNFVPLSPMKSVR